MDGDNNPLAIGPSSSSLSAWHRPAARTPAPLWALTSCLGDPEDTKSWQRVILPACHRCSRLLSQAGDAGRVHKATGVRWFGGHRVGRFEAKGMGGYHEE